MGIFNTSLSLHQIEEKLAAQLKDKKNNIRILGDMDLSYEDYYYLLLKIRGLEQYREHLEIFEEFRLSVLISWIFAMRLEKNEYNSYKRIMEQMAGMKQHHIRTYVSMMLNAFDEYEINTYKMVEEGTLENLMGLLVVHTGIPEDLQDDFCHLLDDSLVYGEFSAVEHRFLMRLPEHIKRLYHNVERHIIVNMMDYCRQMFTDYRLHGITRREAYKKYPLMSSNLMKGCFQWCEAQELYAMKRFG